MTTRVSINETEIGPIRSLGKMGTPEIVAHNEVHVWAKLFAETSLTAREREAFRHRMAHMIGCSWCSNLRGSSLVANPETGGAHDAPRNTSISDDFYENIFDSSWSGYSARESIIIELVTRFSDDHEALRDDKKFWAHVHAHFSENEIVDICYHMIGPQLGRARMAKILLGYSELCEVVPKHASQSVLTLPA